jgi:hypothetical protein
VTFFLGKLVVDGAGTRAAALAVVDAVRTRPCFFVFALSSTTSSCTTSAFFGRPRSRGAVVVDVLVVVVVVSLALAAPRAGRLGFVVSFCVSGFSRLAPSAAAFLDLVALGLGRFCEGLGSSCGGSWIPVVLFKGVILSRRGGAAVAFLLADLRSGSLMIGISLSSGLSPIASTFSSTFLRIDDFRVTLVLDVFVTSPTLLAAARARVTLF